jgi:hypothetical protein
MIEGRVPRVMIATTPRPIPVLREHVKASTCRVTRGTRQDWDFFARADQACANSAKRALSSSNNNIAWAKPAGP